MVNGLSILETALLCWKWLKNLTNSLNMCEMTYICRKQLKNFQKRVKYVGNDVEMWELATNMLGNGLSI